MATDEKRDQQHSQRYTKTEIALQRKAAAAEGKRLYEWQRDTLVEAAIDNDRMRTTIEALAKEGGEHFASLAAQISKNNAAQIELGLATIREEMKAGIDATVRAASVTRSAVTDNAPVMLAIDALRDESFSAIAGLKNYIGDLLRALGHVDEAPAQSSAPAAPDAASGALRLGGGWSGGSNAAR